MAGEKETIQYYIQRLYDRGLTTMSGGNLSVKSREGIFVTPSATDKGTLKPSDIMEVLNDGTKVGPHKVTSEFPVHKRIYENNPGKNAVLHSHTPSILGASVARVLPDISLLAYVFSNFNNQVAMAKYREPGSCELADETGKVLSGSKTAAILENHGVFIVGRTMEECYDNLEDLDLICKIQRNVQKLGGKAKKLTDEDVSRYMAFKPESPEKRDDFDSGEYLKESELIATLLKRLYKRNITTSKNVCFSYRLENGDIVVNPKDKDIAELTAADMVVAGDRWYSGKEEPHKDFYVHKSILDSNKDINCVITSRPPYVMAYGASDCEYTTKVVPECYWCLSAVKKFGFSFGDRLSDFLKDYFNRAHNAVIIENNMFIVTGQAPLGTYDRLEVAEATAEAIIETYPMAKPVEIDEKSVRRLDTNSFGLEH